MNKVMIKFIYISVFIVLNVKIKEIINDKLLIKKIEQFSLIKINKQYYDHFKIIFKKIS
jgi:hypothetical protein